jgi:hypothetical protein
MPVIPADNDEFHQSLLLFKKDIIVAEFYNKPGEFLIHIHPVST